MAAQQYRARAAELLAQSELEHDPEVAEILRTVAGCFRQLADAAPLPLEFELPRSGLFLREPFKKWHANAAGHISRIRQVPAWCGMLPSQGRESTVAIYKLIANGAFGPDEIEVMKSAYEAALIDLGVTDRKDPITDLIAKAIVNVTASGERNPKEVMDRALNALGVRKPAA